jgi:hypothetical protein
LRISRWHRPKHTRFALRSTTLVFAIPVGCFSSRRDA